MRGSPAGQLPAQGALLRRDLEEVKAEASG